MQKKTKVCFFGGLTDSENYTKTGDEKMEKHRAIYVANPAEFGFGIEVMKRAKICGECGNVEGAHNVLCSKCGAKLPEETLFQIYQSKHRKCGDCNTVLAAYMRYCPCCGRKIK